MTPVEKYVREYAASIGMDPDIAAKVVGGEGGFKDPYRHGEGPAPHSQAPGFGPRENSFGPLQLYISGNNAGLGDRALAAGIDPRKDWQGGVRFGLNEANQKGWGQWYGAKNQGITGMMGTSGLSGPRPGLSLTSTPSNPVPDLPVVNVADHPVADVAAAPDAVAAAAPTNPIMDAITKLTTEGKDGKASPLGALADAYSGKGGSSAPPADNIIQTGALQSSDAVQQSQMANAQQLMQTLLAKRKRPGLQLGGMPGMMG